MDRKIIIGFISGLIVTSIGVFFAHYLTQRSANIKLRDQESKVISSIIDGCGSIKQHLLNGILHFEGKSMLQWPGNKIWFQTIKPDELSKLLNEAAQAKLISERTAYLFNLHSKSILFIYNHLDTHGGTSDVKVNIRNINTYIEYLDFLMRLTSIELQYLKRETDESERIELINSLLYQDSGMAWHLSSLPK